MSLRDVLTRAEEAERQAHKPHVMGDDLDELGLMQHAIETSSDFHAAFPPSLVRELVDALEWIGRYDPNSATDWQEDFHAVQRRACKALSRLDSRTPE